MHMNSITIERKRNECNALPKGWQREEVVRKSGIAAGKVDVYYYSPTGKRIDSKPQLARHLGDAFDISCFDFQSGKLIQPMLPPGISLYRGSSTTITPTNSGAGNGANLKRKLKGGNSLNNNTNNHQANNSNNYGMNIPLGISMTTTSNSSTANAGQTNQNQTAASNLLRQQFDPSRSIRPDVSLVPPIRQTASIFKQPVTVIRNHENGKVKHDTKNGTQEKPKQLFWEKRLERLRACHATGEELHDITLPKYIRAVGPNVNEQTVLQSLATALHVLSGPVTGQTSTKTDLSKNAMAFMNPEQPLMHNVAISEEDIRKQEERVSVARRKLSDALKV